MHHPTCPICMARPPGILTRLCPIYSPRGMHHIPCSFFYNLTLQSILLVTTLSFIIRFSSKPLERNARVFTRPRQSGFESSKDCIIVRECNQKPREITLFLNFRGASRRTLINRSSPLRGVGLWEKYLLPPQSYLSHDISLLLGSRSQHLICNRG